MVDFEDKVIVDEVLENLIKNLTEREQLFIKSYVRHLSKSRAAVDAKTKGENPGQIGWAIYNRPKVNEAIQQYFKDSEIKLNETIEIARKISEANISDYFTIKQHIEAKREKVGLAVIIKRLEIDLGVEQDYLLMLEKFDPIEITVCKQSIKHLTRKIGRLKSRLSLDPGAYEFEQVESIVSERVLNLDKLVEDRIPLKKVKYTANGVEVELYSVPDNLEKLLRLKGAYREDNMQKALPVNILNINPLNAANPGTTEDNNTEEKN